MVNLSFQPDIHLGARAEVKPISFYHSYWRQEKVYSHRIPHISQLWPGALGPWQFKKPPVIQEALKYVASRPHGCILWSPGFNIEVGSFRYTDHACNFFLHINN
jgi:hypothetical protein